MSDRLGIDDSTMYIALFALLIYFIQSSHLSLCLVGIGLVLGVKLEVLVRRTEEHLTVRAS